MSVAIIAHYLGPRLGIGQYLDRLLPPLVEELQLRGVNLLILGSPNAVEKTPALQKLGEALRVLPALDYSPGKRYAWFATSFTGYCRREEIEAVAWLSNPIVLPWHPPTLAVIHDVNEWKTGTKYGSRMNTALRAAIYLDASIHFAREIIVVSQVTENDLLHFRPDPKLRAKLRAIANGSDSNLVNLPPVGIPAPTAPFLLSVGRIDPSAKRLPEAVTLVSAIREITKESWELHLVGGMNTSTQLAGEAFLESIQDLAWVHYHGHVSDLVLAQWYRCATAVVFLSDNEGFGFPIAEAASFGRWAIVNQLNQAAIEVGGASIIPIDLNNIHSAASTVLHQIEQGQPPVAVLHQWSDSAKAYADAICNLLQ
jgi:glycosyltransferase involved in cell wall biosynthesis